MGRGWGGVGFFFQAEDVIRDLVRSRGLGDVYKRQVRGPAVAEATDGTVLAAATTAAWSPCVMTTSGSELPAGKDLASRSAAAIAPGLARNLSLIHI